MSDWLIYDRPEPAARKPGFWRRTLLAVARVLADAEALRTWGAPLPPAQTATEARSAGTTTGRVA